MKKLPSNSREGWIRKGSKMTGYCPYLPLHLERNVHCYFALSENGAEPIPTAIGAASFFSPASLVMLFLVIAEAPVLLVLRQ